MRIRKHAPGGVYAAAAAAGYSVNPAGGVSIQSPHLCLLNQSPWDIDSAFSNFPPLSEEEEDPADLLLPPPPSPPPPPSFWQVDGEVSSLENGPISELHQPDYSELSMNVEIWEDKNDGNLEGINQMSRESSKNRNSNSNNCREHQLLKKKQHYINARKLEKNNNPKRKPKKPAAAALVSSSSNNPYEYYYYSGFGPCWRKRNRGGTSIEADKMVVEIEIGSSSYNSESLREAGGVVVKGDHEQVESYNSESLENDNVTEEDKRISPGQVVFKEDSFGARARICNFEDGFDYLDVDEDEDEDDDDNVEFLRRKRVRKPVKARSLKSLMDKRT